MVASRKVPLSVGYACGIACNTAVLGTTSVLGATRHQVSGVLATQSFWTFCPCRQHDGRRLSTGQAHSARHVMPTECGAVRNSSLGSQPVLGWRNVSIGIALEFIVLWTEGKAERLRRSSTVLVALTSHETCLKYSSSLTTFVQSPPGVDCMLCSERITK